jgi:hypothetical protein
VNSGRKKGEKNMLFILIFLCAMFQSANAMEDQPPEDQSAEQLQKTLQFEEITKRDILLLLDELEKDLDDIIAGRVGNEDDRGNESQLR